jgi:poly(hydroxyalkanoate) granule-associated protein
MKKTSRQAGALRPLIMDSAQQIWLAGLGAFAMAGEEGNRLFHQLIKRGEAVQKAGRARVQKLVRKAEDLREDAQAALGKVRLPVDEGVTKAMHRLGVPTRREILDLTKRVEALTRAVERKKPRPKRRSPRPPAVPTV